MLCCSSRPARLALLAAGFVPALAAAALAAEGRRIAISGEPLDDLLARSRRPAVAAAVVRADPPPAPRAWVVESVVAGKSEVARRLEFSKCAPVLRIGSTPRYIRSLLAAPVVEGEVEGVRTVVLPAGKELRDFDAPRPDDRFLLLFEPRPDGAWAFAVQTVGDVYLLRGERAFRLTWVQKGEPATITTEPVWAPLRDVTAEALVERVRSRGLP